MEFFHNETVGWPRAERSGIGVAGQFFPILGDKKGKLPAESAANRSPISARVGGSNEVAVPWITASV